jgi:predicted permease
VIINEEFARRWLPGEDPIGKRLRLGDAKSEEPWATIVGVVRDFRHYRLPEPMGPAVYLPYASTPLLSQTLVIRTSLPDPMVLVPSVRAAIRELDPSVAAYDIQTMDEVVSRSLWRQRFQGEVLGAFALLALVLTAVGIYGVISYAVAQRTRELGVRIALGATRREVLGLILGHGTRLALAGVAIGVVAALGLARVVASLLHGVGPTDPVTFVAVSVTLAVVAVAACYVPARRATGVDPLVAMRAE